MPCLSRGQCLAPLLWVVSAAAVAQQPPVARGGPETRDQQLEFTLLGGATFSDNVARASTDEEDGTIGVIGTQLKYIQESRRFKTDVDLNAAYEKYFDDTFDDGVVGGVDASLDIGIVPERFLWVFQENFGQIQSNRFASTTPENRENINYFTTGPDIAFHLGDTMSLTLSGRHSETNYEKQNLDGQQNGGGLSLGRQLSAKSTLSMNVEAEQFEFDDEIANPNYDRQRAFLRYDMDVARTALKVDAGYTAIDIDGEKSDGLLARVSLSRQVSPGSTFSLSAGNEFSDSAELFRSGQDQSGVSIETPGLDASSDPFTNRYASLGFDFNRHRTSFGVSLQYSKEMYETQTELDRTITTYGLYLGRQLSPVLSARLFGALDQRRSDDITFDDDEMRVGVNLELAIGRTLALKFQYQLYDRDSSLAQTDYTENQASLFLLWSPVRSR